MQAFSIFEKFIMLSIVVTVATMVTGILAMWPILYQLNAYMALG